MSEGIKLKSLSKFIFFEDAGVLKFGKYPNFYVKNKRLNQTLGFLEYDKSWKKFAFLPLSGGIFCSDCLNAITHALTELNKLEVPA